LLLTENVLSRINPLTLNSSTVSIDPSLGRPLRVLWDPTRNQGLIVGSSAIQLESGAIAPFVPCDADTIVDAQLTAAGTGHRRNAHDLALLVTQGSTFLHCEIDLDTYAAAVTEALPPAC